jgi:hypothetical protein
MRLSADCQSSGGELLVSLVRSIMLVQRLEAIKKTL